MAKHNPLFCVSASSQCIRLPLSLTSTISHILLFSAGKRRAFIEKCTVEPSSEETSPLQLHSWNKRSVKVKKNGATERSGRVKGGMVEVFNPFHAHTHTKIKEKRRIKQKTKKEFKGKT